MVDAAGAIYVIGSGNHTGYSQDVWASTDGGARPDAVRGWSVGYWVGTQGLLAGVLRGTNEYSRGFYRGTKASSGC